LAIGGGNNIVIGTPSPTSDDWYYPTQSTTVSSDWVWGTVPGQSRNALTNYQIDGVYQNPSRANSGTLVVAVTFTTDPIVTFDSTVQYYLTVNGGDGVTYGTPSPTADNWYDSGTSTTVSSNGIYSRASGTGQRVASWNIDGGTNNNVTTSGTVTTSSLIMVNYYTVNFNSVTQYLIAFAASPSGGGSPSASTSPPISGDTGWYDTGSVISISANPSFGYTLTSWSASTGSITFGSPTSASTTATIGGTGTITAGFLFSPAIPAFPFPFAIPVMLAITALIYLATRKRMLRGQAGPVQQQT
jgi:hypothetical protein